MMTFTSTDRRAACDMLPPLDHLPDEVERVCVAHQNYTIITHLNHTHAERVRIAQRAQHIARTASEEVEHGEH